MATVLALLGLGSATAFADSPAKPASGDAEQLYRTQVAPFFAKYCADCHGADVQEGDIAFHGYKDAAAVAADTKVFQRTIQMLRSGAMPPEDVDQPSEAERKQIVTWLEQTIYNFDCQQAQSVDPGRVTIRRLNRAEYNNTVRDLLGVSFQPANDFPSDDVGGGFDNIGDVLTLPPLLMEKYLAAAERIAEESIVADLSRFITSHHRDRRQLTPEGSATYNDDRRWWVMASDGGVSAEIEFPRDGEYLLRVFARQQAAGDEPAKVAIRVGTREVRVLSVEETDKTDKLEVKTHVAKGNWRVAAHFVNDYYNEKAPEDERDRNLIVQAIEVDGPLDVRPEDLPDSHRKLIFVRPDDSRSVLDAAKTNLRPLLNRAFRRKVSDDDVAKYAGLVEQSVSEGDSFEQGMQVALTAVLVSPQFLFRAEWDAKPNDKLAVHDISDFELASRLSYFLWSSMPDDALFALAAQNKLHEPAVLEQQIKRMLADPKSDALVQNFVTQWLNLRLLDGVTPDPEHFPKFDAELKAAMRRETELFATAIMREDRSVLDFIEGRYTFVNARLARHYGMKNVWGEQFRRVEFTPEDRRSGVLTHASVLTLTSNPGRTSPVKRGKWILDNILGSPPPDPPPDVPNLEVTQKSQPDMPLRKQLEIHRSNAVCASCHKVMDQLGFGLENFNAIGQWREKDGKFEVDASGELPGGQKFAGPLELAGVLQARRTELVRCLAEKMLTYALGRELAVQDRCAVDKIVESVEAKDYRFSALVTAIVESDPFRKRRGDGGQP